mgnify:FL=1
MAEQNSKKGKRRFPPSELPGFREREKSNGGGRGGVLGFGFVHQQSIHPFFHLDISFILFNFFVFTFLPSLYPSQRQQYRRSPKLLALILQASLSDIPAILTRTALDILPRE